jgi:hypothetical protein
VITLQGTRPISIDEVAELLPKRNGKAVSYGTITRWILKGVRDPLNSAARIRLKAGKAGGQWVTTVANVEAFLQRQTVDEERPRTEKQTSRAAAYADQQLTESGW